MKHLRLFEEFKKVLTSSSGSGRTKHFDNIFDDPIDAKSPSASILLKKDLEEREQEDLIDILPNKQAIRQYIKRSGNDKLIKRIDKFRVTMNNLQFLKDKAKEGELRCEYCNKGPLVIYDINKKDATPENLSNPKFRFNSKFSPKDGATCDHKQPQSKGGDKFDYSNLAVCCYQCNKEKGNKDYDTWMNIVNNKKDKIKHPIPLSSYPS